MLLALSMISCGSGGSDDDAAGAGGDAPGALLENQTFEHDGVSRTFHFYRAGGDEPRPLVLVLHGGGATIDAFVGNTGGAAPLAGVWLQLAEAHGLHVVIPQGLSTSAGAHWNDCRGDCTHCGEQDDAGFLLALVESLTESHPVDAARIYVSGESNGGFMALRLAQEAPHRFAAFAATVALMPAQNSCAPAESPAAVAFVLGTEDATSRYNGGQAVLAASGTMLSADDSVAYWVERNKCGPTPAIVPLPDGPEDDGSSVHLFRYWCDVTGKEVLLYRVDGGGHVVPSIDQQVSAAWEALVGRQNHDIETAQEQWAFFQRHVR